MGVLDLLNPATGVLTAVEGIVSHFWPDKTAEEQQKVGLELQAMMNTQQITLGQIQVDNTEAASSDKMQHWCGALGWVCVFAFAWQFVGAPFITYLLLVSGVHLPPLPVLDSVPLFTLCTGMLGLGAMHVTERVQRRIVIQCPSCGVWNKPHDKCFMCGTRLPRAKNLARLFVLQDAV